MKSGISSQLGPLDFSLGSSNSRYGTVESAVLQGL